MTFPRHDFWWSVACGGSGTVNLGTLHLGNTNVNQIDDAVRLTVTFGDPACTPVSKTFTADVLATRTAAFAMSGSTT